MKITSIKSPPEGCELWSGMAIKDGNRFQWFIEPDGSLFHVLEEDLVCSIRESIRTGEERNCFMNVEPPPGSKETVLKAIRGSMS